MRLKRSSVKSDRVDDGDDDDDDEEEYKQE